MQVSNLFNVNNTGSALHSLPSQRPLLRVLDNTNMPRISVNMCGFCLVLYRALDKCDAGLFNKLVGIYPELAAHERSVDTLIDLFKKDQV